MTVKNETYVIKEVVQLILRADHVHSFFFNWMLLHLIAYDFVHSYHIHTRYIEDERTNIPIYTSNNKNCKKED